MKRNLYRTSYGKNEEQQLDNGIKWAVDSFKNWIKRFEGEDSPIGDLADDIARDKEFTEDNSRLGIRDYLWSMGAVRGCVEAFHEAYNIYEKEKE